LAPPIESLPVSGAPVSTTTKEVATTPVVINTTGEATGGSGTAVMNTLFNATSQDAMPAEITPAIVRSSGVTLDSAPGAGDGAVLGRGAILNVTGTSNDGAYLQVETTSTPVQTGWVALSGVIYTGVRIGDSMGDDVTASVTPTVTESAPSATTDAIPAADSSATEERTVVTEASSAMGAVTGYGEVTVASGTSRLNVRSAPGTANAIVGKSEPGTSLTLLGKTADGSWLQVITSEGITGWVAASYVTGDTSAAPILDEPVTDAAPAASAPGEITGTATASAAAAPASGSGDTGLTGTIVYQTSPGGTFYAYNLETGVQTALTSGWDPAISPDGQTVAFVRGGGENGIWLIDIDGSNERLIYGERRDLSSPKWSPDGAYIVFGRGDSYITCRQIGRECLPDDVWLDRNPNMDLDQFPLVDEYLQRIARIDKDGNNYRDIASLDSGREPDWSSEGIVYASSDGLQLTDDTENAVNSVVYFEPLQARDQDPDWAGGRIVFVTKQSSHYQIFSVHPDGTGKTSLTKPATTLVDQIPSNVAPAYSPDGKHVLFLSNRQADNEAGAWHIWVMDADGSNQRQLPIDAAIEYDFNHMEQALSWGA
jgi:uncharacterized protein YraI